MTSYLVVILLFALPIAVKLFADVFFPFEARTMENLATLQLRDYLFVSPFAATFSLPLHLESGGQLSTGSENWSLLTTPAFLLFYSLLDLSLIAAMIGLFKARWRAVTRSF